MLKLSVRLLKNEKGFEIRRFIFITEVLRDKTICEIITKRNFALKLLEIRKDTYSWCNRKCYI